MLHRRCGRMLVLAVVAGALSCLNELSKISFETCGNRKFSQAGATLDAFVLFFVFVVFVRQSFDYQGRVGFTFLEADDFAPSGDVGQITESAAVFGGLLAILVAIRTGEFCRRWWEDRQSVSYGESNLVCAIAFP